MSVEGRSCVLVIEDDADFREMICQALEQDGFEAIGAENGRVGVALAMDTPPSLVLCDVRMPELDGHDTLTQLRRLPGTADVPFVFLSGGADLKDIRHGMNLGADDYLVKPFTLEELRATVRARLQRHAERPSVTRTPGTVTATIPIPLITKGSSTVIAERYLLLRQAGEGGMGTVYEALDEQTGDTVAVKLIAVTSASERRFRRESAALAKMRHARVVPYRAHGETGDGYHYLVMDWLSGADLSARLHRGALAIKDAVRVVQYAAEALADVHAEGVVHRDVKPGNLFLINNDIERLTLIDFGLARPLETTGSQTGALIGTPGYLAPEMVHDGLAPDARCDVFALGCVAYECLTGLAPFRAPTVMASIARLLLDDVPRAKDRRPEVSDALNGLVAKMMHRDPNERLADGAAVLRAMTEAGLKS